jgi:hypothetical protein
MVFFFFQKKKQKALFRFAEVSISPSLGEADPGGLGALPPGNQQLVVLYETIILVGFFFFQKKRSSLSRVFINIGQCCKHPFRREVENFYCQCSNRTAHLTQYTQFGSDCGKRVE